MAKETKFYENQTIYENQTLFEVAHEIAEKSNNLYRVSYVTSQQDIKKYGEYENGSDLLNGLKELHEKITQKAKSYKTNRILLKTKKINPNSRKLNKKEMNNLKENLEEKLNAEIKIT